MAAPDGAVSENQKKQFEDEGLVIVDPGIPESVVNQSVKDFQPYWNGKRATTVAYADRKRVQDGWVISSACFKIATSPNILSILRQLYNREPRPFQTLNFPVGTEQKPHSDAVHFNCEPFGLMCGVWVALEDVGADQGPLIYYPGSHKWPETNYHDIGIEADPTNYSKYEAYIESQITKRQLKPAYGIVQKGQAIVWAANLLHGGSERKDKSKTRHSQVTHYYFDGAKPWRPAYSKTERVYFEPDWVAAERAASRRWQLRKYNWRERIRKLLGRT